MRTLTFLLVATLLTAPLIQVKSQRISAPSPQQSDAVDSVNTNNAASFKPGTVFAVDSVNHLLHFDQAMPGKIDGSVPIANIQPGENILSIDFRPATGQLYGLGSTSQIYIINPVTGVALPVGGMFTPALSGTAFGFDFNPTSDRIRVVSDAEQNLRLNPDTGAVAGVDLAINPAGELVGSAYSNNFSGATTTTLYGIDSGSDTLVIQNPPNDGIVSPVGSLGFDTNNLVGFDITAAGTAYASLTGPVASSSNFFTINLASGAATLVGTIGGGLTIRSIALVTGPETVYAVTTSNKLLRFNSNTPGAIISTLPITGMQAGEITEGIDFRPATGQLYALGSTSRLYVIDPFTGAATQVGTGTFSPALSGTDFGFDFNPTVDRIRVVSDTEQNLRLNPITGTVTFADAPLNPPGNVVAAAYTNNFAGAISTTLYDIDSNSDLLLIQNPPNSGVLSAIGPLNVNTSGLTGFDISPAGGAFASLTAPAATTTNFYTINLTTGAATLVGAIGGGETIRDVAIQLSTEVIYGVTLSGATSNLITFNAATPSIILSGVALTGLQAGETIVGIDFRPATGQLYAIGSTSRVYTINISTGAVTALGPPFTPVLNGTSFGVDFNPTVDRIRVVSNTEQNLRLNPDTGANTAVDNPLNPTGNIVAAAYTNNFAGATTTTLYDVDSGTDQLLIQNPANGGTLTPVGSLGVNLSDVAGFDIASGSGTAYLSGYLPAASSPSLFTINLETGAATLVGTIATTDILVGIAVSPAAGTVQFTATTASIGEGGGKITLTVTRSGNTSVPSAVDFATSDVTATQRSDYIIALGTLQFAAGETSKQFDVLIVDDGFVDPGETFRVSLSSPTNDFAVGNGIVTVNITDNDAVPSATNPIDDNAFFVRQHYLDFLNREPDTDGFNFWKAELDSCGTNAACLDLKRQNVSAAFFLSIEFQETGGTVLRLQRLAFGKKSNEAATRTPYLQFWRDTRQVGLGVVVGQPGHLTVLENNNQAYATQVVSSAEFVNRYASSLSASEFVDALFSSAGVTPTPIERTAAIDVFNTAGGGLAGRVAALRSATDCSSMRMAEMNPSFVLMQYYGYLRRNPTDPPDGNDDGYLFWLTKLNNFNGDFVKAEMVKAFLLSGEYRSRFR
jgi:hypothetical protein